MKTRLLIFATLVGLLMACHKDDGASTSIPDPQSENRAPGTFGLLTVENEGTDIDLLPTLTWSTATDPDGEAVKYDVYLGLEIDPTSKVVSDLNTATYTLVEKLDMVKEYHWKVVATDGKGGETSSGVFSFKTRPAKVTRIQTTNPFNERFHHTSLVYQDKMWVIGGSTTITGLDKNDVWASSDGIAWDEIKPNTPDTFIERSLHCSIVFNDRIYVVGGVDEDDKQRNDVWYSSNGLEWFEEKDAFGLPLLSSQGMEVFREQMWIIGGSTNGQTTSGSWSSNTGIGWFDLFPGNRFTPRRRHATIVFDDKIWVIGGVTGTGLDTVLYNDVWQSDNGSAWTEVTEKADFSPRLSAKVVVYENKMWLIGGSSTNEIWYSTDGETWINATPEESFLRADGHTSVVFQDKIWILGGGTQEEDNMVWTIE